jgi:hypothetical protein
MNDVIEVVGLFNECPVLKFMFKGKGITNMQGEKLSEKQFIEAIGRARDKAGIAHEFFIGYADVDSSQYKIYLEFTKEYSQQEKQAFAKAVDDSLCEVNVEYEAKFKSERLRPVEIIDMGKDFFPRYRTIRLQEGAHEGQIKWLHLSSTKADKRRLEKLRSDK